MKLIKGSDKVKPLTPEAREARRRGLVFGSWAKDRLAFGAKVDDLVRSLARICEIKLDREEGSRILAFDFNSSVRVTIRVIFGDRQSGAHMAITNMTVLPTVETGNGYGTKALQKLLEWAQGEGLTHIEAVQVQSQSEAFWIRNSFAAKRNVTNDFRYTPS